MDARIAEPGRRAKDEFYFPAPQRAGKGGVETVREIVKETRLAKLGESHGAEAGLGLFGEAGKDHGDVVADMFAAGTGNDHAVAMDFAAIAGGLKGHCHFGPRGKRSGTSEFDAILVDNHRVRGKGEACLAGLDCKILQGARKIGFSSAHIACSEYHISGKSQFR